MSKRSVVLFIAKSLDGYIADPNGDLTFLSMVERPGEDYGYGEFFASIDTLVMGRKTYETALSFPEWPYAGKRVVVMTHQYFESRFGEEFFSGLPSKLVSKLEAEGAQHLYVDGGAIIRGFLAENLVDELTLSVIPVLLGEGISLFGAEVQETRLVLQSSRSYPKGLVQLRYLAGHFFSSKDKAPYRKSESP